MNGPVAVPIYPADVVAIDPLAVALRRLRSSLGTDAAGHDDAEDAALLRVTLGQLGQAVVTEAMVAVVEAAVALLHSEMGLAPLLRGDADAREAYEPWAEADALAAALDVARPGWREPYDG
jgi:hypothetical protein